MSIHFGPRHIGAVNAEHLGRLARFAPEDNAPSWWTDRASADYRLAALLFVAPFSDLTEAHIAADPLAFDHALREWKVCDSCKAAQLAESRLKGEENDCALERAIQTFQRSVAGQDYYVWDESLAGSRNYYLDIVQRSDHTWHWAKRRCADKYRRQQLIANRVQGWEQVGGMQAREVEMCKIGLCQVDGKLPNLALLKLSAWHKARGDSVAWWSPLESYDLTYAAKVFDFSPDNAYLPLGTVRGGTGYDLTTNLPPEVEAMFPDYSLYPQMDYALGFTTRGCVRQCPFCVVPRKEGRLRVVGDLRGFWAGQRKVGLLDNNLTAAPMAHFGLIIQQLKENRLSVDFNQGLDIRLLNEGHAELLAGVRLLKQIHFAWDNLADEDAVRRGIALLGGYMPLSRIMFYVLIGYDSTPAEDYYRVMELRALGADPFVMPFVKRDPYQRAFARWVNHKAVFKTVPWARYHGRPREVEE